MDLQDICVSCFAGGLVPTKEPAGQITFQDVSFTYPSRPDTRVIRNLTLDIPEASITAVVGASGSGKSTLAALLLRLYDPDSGTVLLDGQPVGQLDPRWLRSHIGSVSQVCEPRHCDYLACQRTANVNLHCLSSHINLVEFMWPRQKPSRVVEPTLVVKSHQVIVTVHLPCIKCTYGVFLHRNQSYSHVLSVKISYMEQWIPQK